MNMDCAVTYKKEDAERKWCPFPWARMNIGAEVPRPKVRDIQANELGHSLSRKTPGGQCLTTDCMV